MFFFKKDLFKDYLINHVIVNVEIDNEGIGIVFDYNLHFGIDNKYKILGAKKSDFKDLIGCKVLKVKQTKDIFLIILTNNITIEVGLRDKNYNGPEAMQLVLSDGQIIIF